MGWNSKSQIVFGPSQKIQKSCSDATKYCFRMLAIFKQSLRWPKMIELLNWSVRVTVRGKFGIPTESSCDVVLWCKVNDGVFLKLCYRPRYVSINCDQNFIQLPAILSLHFDMNGFVNVVKFKSPYWNHLSYHFCPPLMVFLKTLSMSSTLENKWTIRFKVTQRNFVVPVTFWFNGGVKLCFTFFRLHLTTFGRVSYGLVILAIVFSTTLLCL